MSFTYGGSATLILLGGYQLKHRVFSCQEEVKAADPSEIPLRYVPQLPVPLDVPLEIQPVIRASVTRASLFLKLSVTESSTGSRVRVHPLLGPLFPSSHSIDLGGQGPHL